MNRRDFFSKSLPVLGLGLVGSECLAKESKGGEWPSVNRATSKVIFRINDKVRAGISISCGQRTESGHFEGKIVSISSRGSSQHSTHNEYTDWFDKKVQNSCEKLIYEVYNEAGVWLQFCYEDLELIESGNEFNKVTSCILPTRFFRLGDKVKCPSGRIGIITGMEINSNAYARHMIKKTKTKQKLLFTIECLERNIRCWEYRVFEELEFIESAPINSFV